MIARRDRIGYSEANVDVGGHQMAQTNENPTAAYHPDMDGKEHEKTYLGFMHFTEVAVVFVLCIVVALAVGGAKQAWFSAGVMVLFACITAGVGLVSEKISWRAPGVVLALLLVMLLLY